MLEGESNQWLLSGLILASAALITWATGFWGYGVWDYGLPLMWKIGGCPFPPSMVACSPFSYVLPTFLADVIFYAVLGYAIVFRLLHRRSSGSSRVYGVVLLSLGLLVFIFGVIGEIFGLSPLFLELFPKLDASILAQDVVIVILGVILIRFGQSSLRRPKPSP